MKAAAISILFLAIPFCLADAAVFIEFPGIIEKLCVPAKQGESAKAILENSGFQISYKFNGGFVDSISNLSCEKSSCWFFFHGEPPEYSEVGIKQYKVNPMDVIYLGYYNYSSDFRPMGKPLNVSYAEICRNEFKPEEYVKDSFKPSVIFLILIAGGIILLVIKRFMK